MTEPEPIAIGDEIWVFGYGSLIWNPDFPVAARRLARAPGWRRSFCMHSFQFRGTESEPGLVLALDRGEADDACAGVALLMAAEGAADSLARLRARELVSSAYHEARIPLVTDAGPVEAITFVIDRHHPQYCGALPLEEQARIIARAHGNRGPNRDYLWQTVAALDRLGLHDPDLAWLARRVRALSSPRPAPAGTREPPPK